MNSLGALLAALAGPLAKRVLIALGFAVVTYAGVDTVLTTALTSAKGSLAGLDPMSLALLAKGGVPTALGIIAGAMVTRLSLMTLKKLMPT